MAWPHNHFNNYWGPMYGPNPHGPRGAGVDHAPPPPPPELPDFANPDYWNRWVQRRGWEDFMRPAEGPRGHGPHGHHAHAHAHASRKGGRRHGRGSGDEDEAERAGPAHEASDNEAFPPEYISDDEVAAATAAAGEKKGSGEKDASPDTTMRDETEDPPEEVPNPSDGEGPRHRGGKHGRRGRGGFRREGFKGGRGGPRGMHHHGGPSPLGAREGPGGRRGGPRGMHHHGPPPFGPYGPMFGGMFGGPRGPRGHGRHHRGPPPPGSEGAFDFRDMMHAFAHHPYAYHVREYLERAQRDANNTDDNNGAVTPDSTDDGMDASFAPPLDLFEQPDRWVLHLAVPGAKKEDVGVNWDADRLILSIGGVIHRPGDEEFLAGLVSGERSVGLFSRDVRLPPLEGSGQGSKEEVNSEGIVARMEDGILIVTVPKVERDWTEVKRVEIE